MTEALKQDHQEILNQIHSDIVLDGLRDYVDPDGDVPEKVASDLNDLTERLLVHDSSLSIERTKIEKLLEDDEIRDELKQSIRNLIKSQSKEEP